MRQILIFAMTITFAGCNANPFSEWWQPQKDETVLTMYGNVDIRQVDLSFRVGGRIETMHFEEGDAVSSGELVAVLDKEPYQNDYNLAAANVERASATLNKFLSGSRPQEIERAQALVRERTTTYENAKKEFLRRQELVRTGAVSKERADEAQTRMEEANARLESAQEELNLVLDGFREEDIQATQGDLKAAKAQLDIAQTNLDDTEVFAPANGVIFTRVTEPGAVVSRGQTVYTLSLTSPTWVRAYISETDLGKVKPGMQAEIKTDSYPDKIYRGQIGYISPQAEFTPKNVETPELRTDLVYRIRITVDDPNNELRQGMPVTAQVYLDQAMKESKT